MPTDPYPLGLSAVVGTALALAAVLGLRRGVLFSSAVLPVMVLPIVMPGIVTGVVMLVFFGFTGMRLGLWPTTFFVHVTWVLPFALLTLYPRLAAFDRALEEAAMDLGASPAMVFRRVVFPIIRPGVVGWAKSLARELGPKGITVNCLAPGRIDTERVREVYPDGPTAEDLAAIPLRRLGTTREVGDVVAFLCSERASYVSGIVVLVDGALTRGL